MIWKDTKDIISIMGIMRVPPILILIVAYTHLFQMWMNWYESFLLLYDFP